MRVHFAPFQAKLAVRKNTEPLEGITTSPNGFLSDKYSGVDTPAALFGPHRLQ